VTTPSTQRLARLLSLVPWLTRHDGVTITEAADHFGVTPEQLESDLWLVVCCGLPGHGPEQLIDIQFWDDDGHIDVVDPQTLVAPARLTVEEAATLQVGLSILQTLASGDEHELIEATMTALTEATASLMPTAPGLLSLHVKNPIRTDLDSDPAIMSLVAGAAHSGQPLEIEYYTATSDTVSRRIIWPQRIIVSSTVAYVEAWCTSAGDIRTFRTDRIRSARTVDEGVLAAPAIPESGDVRSRPGTDVLAVDVRIHRNARWLIDSYDFTVTGDSDLGASWIDASIGVWDQRWFIRLVLSMGGDLVVVAPPALRDAVHVAAQEGISANEAG